ncbi:unnamed protein product [Prunus armeniaca]
MGLLVWMAWCTSLNLLGMKPSSQLVEVSNWLQSWVVFSLAYSGSRNKVEACFTNYPSPGTYYPSSSTNLPSFLVHLRSSFEVIDKVKSISQGAEGTLPYPPLRTPDTVAGTSSQLPVALSPTSPCLGTPNLAAGTSPQFPAVLPPTSPCLGTPDIAADTSPQFPAVLPPTSPCLGTFDIAAGTSSRLPAVTPRGEIIGDIHKDGDASTSVGHLSEKIMPWQDWENSFMAFKAFFDGGVTHSMKSSHGSVSFETIGCMDL